MKLNNKYKRYIKCVLVALAVLVGGIVYLVYRSAGQQDTSGYVTSIRLDSDADSELDSESDSETNSDNDSDGAQNTMIASGTSSDDVSDNDNLSEQQTADLNTELIYVYVCGEVTSPGVFTCHLDSRIYELIEMAGGFSENADTTYLNLVDKVSDGMKIYVPAIGEQISGSSQTDGSVTSTSDTSTDSEGLININTATKEELMTLPGIGESKATDIINNRSTEGLFESTEDIMRVSGIKEAAYSKIKDLICVG